MPKDSKTILGRIKAMLSTSDVKLEELTTADGQILFAEVFEAGSAVFLVVDGEQTPLPVGEYTLEDGRVLTVTEDGVIGEIMAVEASVVSDDDLQEIEDQLQKVIDKEVAQSEEIKKKDIEIEALKKENGIKEKLSKEPASGGVKFSPEGKGNAMFDLGTARKPVGTKGRVWERLARTAWNRAAVRLATTTNITTTYAGEFAGMYIAAALLEGLTLAANVLTIKPNIKYKAVVKRLSAEGILADASCDFTPIGTVTLDERILEPKELQVNLQLCKTDFMSDWDALSMGFSAFDILPPSFQEFFIGELLAVVAEANETSIWQGVGATTGQFAGFETLWDADGSVITVDSTAITAENVIAEMTKVYNVIPANVYGKQDVIFYCAADIVRSYQIALGGFGSAGLGAAGYKDEGTVTEKPLFFAGIPVQLCPGMTAGKMASAQISNLWFGTGLMSDQNEVKVLDMADLDGSKNVRFVMRYTAAIQYGFSEEIVYYRPTV